MSIDPQSVRDAIHLLRADLNQLEYLSIRYEKQGVDVAETSLNFDTQALADMRDRYVALRAKLVTDALALRDLLPEV